MNLLLVGLSARDQLAFDLFLKRFMPSWRWRGVTAVKDESLPPSDIVIVDLAANGWAQRSDRSQLELQRAVGSSVVVMLVSAHDVTWSSGEPHEAQKKWVWLGKPYNAESMRSALAQAEVLTKPQRVAASPRPPRQPVERSKVIPQTASQDDAVADVWSGLMPDQLRDRLLRLPGDQHVLLRKLDAALQVGQPFEVRFTVQHGVTVHPVDGWVASNTPKSVVLQVCGSDALAASVTVRELVASQLEQRLHQLGMTPHDLNDFLADLFAASVPNWQTKPVSS
jgi:hypothetical protein